MKRLVVLLVLALFPVSFAQFASGTDPAQVTRAFGMALGEIGHAISAWTLESPTSIPADHR